MSNTAADKDALFWQAVANARTVDEKLDLLFAQPKKK